MTMTGMLLCSAGIYLINRVILKDDSPDTSICYCFKVLNKQALEDIARSGTKDVF